MSLKASTQADKQARHKVPTLEKMQGLLIACMAFSYLLLEFLPEPQVQSLASLLIILVIITALPAMRGSTAIISILLISIGALLMIMWRASWQDWLSGLRVNLTLVTLFIFVPLLGIPVRTGGYVQALQVLFERKMSNPLFYFLGSKLLTHILGVILNIGSIPIVYHLSTASKLKSVRLLADGINRGFSSTVFWSPYFAAMALVLNQLKINWTSIVFYALGLVAISCLVSLWVDLPVLRKTSQECVEIDEAKIDELKVSLAPNELLVGAKQKVVQMFMLIFSMMAIVLLVEMVTSYNMVLIICLVSIIFPLVWNLLFQRGSAYAEEVRQHVYATLPQMKKEIVLFLLAGFFSKAFVQAKLGHYLIEQLQGIFGSFSMGIAFCLVLLVVLSAVLGLHPIVVVTILVTSINPQLLGFSAQYFAVLLLASWGISNAVSPATAANNLLANLAKVDVLELSIKWNYKYMLIMIIILPIYLTLVRL